MRPQQKKFSVSSQNFEVRDSKSSKFVSIFVVLEEFEILAAIPLRPESVRRMVDGEHLLCGVTWHSFEMSSR